MKLNTNQGILFPALSDKHRKIMLSHSTPRAFSKGDTILSRGEPGSLIYIIESGRIEISVTAASGRRTILNQMGPGEVVGELAMLDGGTRSADAVAATDTRGRILTRQHFLLFLNDFPDMAAAIIQEICRKLRHLTDIHADQTTMTGGTRLATVMLRLFRKWGHELPSGETRLEQEFSQSELGEFAGLARENVNRHMRRWTDAGLIRMDGGKLVLIDPDGFARLAQI